MKKQMIAIWGSNGGGKSTVCLALASALARLSKNVVIVSPDIKTPALPLFLPRETKLNINNSLSSLLTLDTINYDSLRSKIHIHPQSDNIGFMGMTSGENPITTQVFKREKIIDFLRILDDAPFDFILFDCESNAFYDTLSLLALEISDNVIRVLTPDVKAIEFEKSQSLWMKNSDNFDISKHIKVLNMIHETSDNKAFEAVRSEERRVGKEC